MAQDFWPINLIILEEELKKRWKYPYKWWRKQNNEWDSKTNFIYSSRTFNSLLTETKDFNLDLKDYAFNRWYNFWSAKWIEQIFCSHLTVKANKNEFDKLVDFSIWNISFDHKTTIYPKWFWKPFIYWKENKEELIKWLYENQSQEWRKHLKNRLFVCLYDTINWEHWKLKAEIGLIKKWIDDYMKNFDEKKLMTFDFWDWIIYSDIIWIER